LFEDGQLHDLEFTAKDRKLYRIGEVWSTESERELTPLKHALCEFGIQHALGAEEIEQLVAQGLGQRRQYPEGAGGKENAVGGCASLRIGSVPRSARIGAEIQAYQCRPPRSTSKICHKATIAPIQLQPVVLSLHIFVMVAFTLALFAMTYDYDGKSELSRIEGIALLVAFLAYDAYVAAQNIHIE
jgi:hypothetical protein